MTTVLIVGLGRMGQHHHAALHRLGHDVITVDQAGHAQHTTITGALRHAWPRVPAAAIAAVPVQHLAETATTLIQRGIPTLIEKPMAATPAQAGDLARLAEQTRTPCTVGYVERHNPAVLALHQRIQATSPAIRIKAVRQGPEPPHGGQSLTDLGTHDLAVADLLDPYVTAHRTILTGYAPHKMRRLTVTTGEGRAHHVDYIARTLDGHRIPGPEPLDGQLQAFLHQAQHGTYQSLWPYTAILAEAHGHHQPAAAA